jgi:hypothetical protein
LIEGKPPSEGRKIAQVCGGDWQLRRSDQVFTLEVRLTVKTDDGDYIYMSYRNSGSQSIILMMPHGGFCFSFSAIKR